MTKAHEHDRFRNAAVHTVAVTYTVAGGARPATARRRAEKVADRIASAAARLRDVVEAHAVAGPAGSDGEILVPTRVRFRAANSGSGTYSEPGRLDRYLDPDHERALASLDAANTAWRRRQDQDRDRRRAVGCENTHGTTDNLRRYCVCVYCEPQRHLDAHPDTATALHTFPPRCICGTAVPSPGMRCRQHRSTAIVVLNDDTGPLKELAARWSDLDAQAGE